MNWSCKGKFSQFQNFNFAQLEIESREHSSESLKTPDQRIHIHTVQQPQDEALAHCGPIRGSGHRSDGGSNVCGRRCSGGGVTGIAFI